MSITRTGPGPPGEFLPGGSVFRVHRHEIGRFGNPLTRMLLAGDGSTTLALEAALNTELAVRVVHQEMIAATGLPALVTEALRLTDSDRAMARRSCLIDPGMVTVSMNHVIASGPAATAAGVDDVHTPIGYSLMARGLGQRRHILRAGLARWSTGEPCATKAYVIVVEGEPLCYIRESFNPSIISADRERSAEGEDLDWADEPVYP